MQLERPSAAKTIKNEGDGDTVVEEVEWVSLGNDFSLGQGTGMKKKTTSMQPRQMQAIILFSLFIVFVFQLEMGNKK